MSGCVCLTQADSLSPREETAMELCAAECHRTVEWFGLEGVSSSSNPLPQAGGRVPSVVCSSSIQTASSDLQTGLHTGVGQVVSLLT